ncbi:MAG: DNA translocase FtsK 4TM domain-containing protein, partial [Planctomycetota bacterium]
MFENRSLKLDLASLTLVAVATFLTAALLTYDSADPPSTLVYPPKQTFDNACGRTGAYAAHALLASVGFGAFYAVGSLALVSLLMVAGRGVNQPVLRGVGWVASLAAITTLATMGLPNRTPGPEIGAGGYLGAMGFALLESHFAAAGAVILAVSVLLAGLLLCTDYLLLRVATVTTAASGTGLLRLGRLARRSNGVERPKTDVEEESGEEVGDEEDEYEQQYDYEDEEAADEDDWEDDWDEGKSEEEGEEHDGEQAETELTVRTPDSKDEAASKTEADAAHADPNSHEPAADGLRTKLSAALGIKRKKNRAEERSERDAVIDQLEAADTQGVDDVDYELPPLDLLLESDEVSYEEHEKEVRRKARLLEKTFRSFGLNVKVVEIETGPVIAQYEVQLEPGLRLSKITGLADDLAIALRVPSVRVVAPIPGKNTVGIEVPNENRQLVRIRDVIEETNGRAKRMKIPVYLGKDVSGNPMVVDLTSMPHL